MTPGKPFDLAEAERLARNALVLVEELIDPGLEIRAEFGRREAAG